MPLNLHPGSGDFTPYMKFNAKEGRWYIGGEKGEGDIEIENPRLAMDLENIETGWICFPQGSAPQYALDVGNHRLPQPEPIGSQDFREGFRVTVHCTNKVDGNEIGLREWASCAGAVKEQILYIYGEWERVKEEHLHEVPVYVCEGVKKIESRYEGSFRPMMKLEKWVSRSKLPRLDEIAEQHRKERGPAVPSQSRTEAPDDFNQVPPDDDDIPF